VNLESKGWSLSDRRPLMRSYRFLSISSKTRPSMCVFGS